MSNPWLKKNPFMSMWLSAANKAAGSMRSAGAAQARRQVNAAVTKATNDALRGSLGSLSPAKPKAAAKKRRR